MNMTAKMEGNDRPGLSPTITTVRSPISYVLPQKLPFNLSASLKTKTTLLKNIIKKAAGVGPPK